MADLPQGHSWAVAGQAGQWGTTRAPVLEERQVVAACRSSAKQLQGLDAGIAGRKLCEMKQIFTSCGEVTLSLYFMSVKFSVQIKASDLFSLFIFYPVQVHVLFSNVE